jgi:hypothetical protein
VIGLFRLLFSRRANSSDALTAGREALRGLLKWVPGAPAKTERDGKAVNSGSGSGIGVVYLLYEVTQRR